MTYVKLTMNGDWTNHSGIMFMGEYFISNGGAGGYNEPGISNDVLATKSIHPHAALSSL